MKKITIICDICGKECTKYKEYIIPRKVRHYIRGRFMNKKLGSFDDIEEKETHICMDCLNNFANMLSIINEE